MPVYQLKIRDGPRLKHQTSKIFKALTVAARSKQSWPYANKMSKDNVSKVSVEFYKLRFLMSSYELKIISSAYLY